MDRSRYLVLETDVFNQVVIRREVDRHLDRERPDVHLRIVVRDLDLHVAEVGPPSLAGAASKLNNNAALVPILDVNMT